MAHYFTGEGTRVPSHIAILGWGSLIWDPRELALVEKDWFADGPLLPVEFARVSGRGRKPERPGYLSLVIHPGSPDVQVLWNLSSLGSFEDARRNLARRERVERRVDRIGVLDLVRGEAHTWLSEELCHNIRSWAEARDLAAVVWTDLRANLDTFGLDPDDPSSIAERLRDSTLFDPVRSEEYVRKAPPQVRTPVRQVIEAELGWTPYPRQ